MLLIIARHVPYNFCYNQYLNFFNIYSKQTIIFKKQPNLLDT